ncbi:hypothetical protein KC356_g2822 [Hortaea werneckii]|nr:hypothetical protein KC356_g2822 [Hortaea werneckii]
MSDLPGNLPTSPTFRSVPDSGKTHELLRSSSNDEEHVHDAQGVLESCSEVSSTNKAQETSCEEEISPPVLDGDCKGTMFTEDMRKSSDSEIATEERLRIIERTSKAPGGSGLREALKKLLLDWCSHDEFRTEMTRGNEEISKENYALESRQTFDAEVQSFKENQEREPELSEKARGMNRQTVKHEVETDFNDSVGEATRAYVQSEVACATNALRQMFHAERRECLERQQQKDAENGELRREMSNLLAAVEPILAREKQMQARISEMETEIIEGQENQSRLRRSQDMLKEKVKDVYDQLDALRSAQQPPAHGYGQAPVQNPAPGYGPGYGPGYWQGYGHGPGHQ